MYMSLYLSGCSSIPQVHNAELYLDDVRKASGLDLPEITSDRCLVAHWTTLPIRGTRLGKGKI